MERHKLRVHILDNTMSCTLAAEAAAFVAGMVAATYGPADYDPPDGDGAPIVVRAFGAEPPTERHLLHWSRLATTSLNRMLAIREAPIRITLDEAPR